MQSTCRAKSRFCPLNQLVVRGFANLAWSCVNHADRRQRKLSERHSLCDSLPAGLAGGRAVTRVLDQLIESSGKPTARRCADSYERIGVSLVTRASQRDIRVEYIQPGESQQNARIACHN